MHDTPEIEDEAVIPRCNLSHAADDPNGHDAPLVPTETCGTLAWSTPTASATAAKPSRWSRAARPVLISPARVGPRKTRAVWSCTSDATARLLAQAFSAYATG